MQRVLVLAGAAFVLFSSLVVSAQNFLNPQSIYQQHSPLLEKTVPSPKVPELIVGERAEPPIGWTKFCEDYAPKDDCKTTPMKKSILNLAPESLRQLQSVNLSTNKRIKLMTDYDHWGLSKSRYVYYDVKTGALLDVDKWDYAEDGYGDCEDFVLVKRRKLLELGWPRSALLITFVKHYVERSGRGKVLEGHAVLTVRTSVGDLILDIFTDEIKPWWNTAYQYISRQSEEDPSVWVSLSKPNLASAK